MRKSHFWLVLLLSTILFSVQSSFIHAQDNTACSSSTRLAIYQWAKTTPGDANNVRLQASLQGEIVGQIPGETLFRVLDGPICADNIIWWQVETEGSALRGWMAEGAGGKAFVEALAEASAASYHELVRMGRGTIETIAWRPDGKRLLSAGLDGTLRIWGTLGGES